MHHESIGTGGLNYTSLGLGYALGAQVNAHMNDAIYWGLKSKKKDVRPPEYLIFFKFLLPPC